tara:strand:- start:494 stop:850 length:357 start_codon:yes stop_codon:yes gene_type:complete
MKNLLIILLLPIFGISQTKQEVYDYLVEINCKYPKIVTAQAILETGYFKSYSCRTRHNLFGLRYNHKYLIFDTWKESCDAYLSKIQYKYKGGDYYKFLTNLGYASDPEYINKLKRMKI